MADKPLTTRLPCANIGQVEGSQCLKLAPNVCKGCFLVQVSPVFLRLSPSLLTSILNVVLQQGVLAGSLEFAQDGL
jgi:hypothetical protein